MNFTLGWAQTSHFSRSVRPWKIPLKGATINYDNSNFLTHKSRENFSIHFSEFAKYQQGGNKKFMDGQKPTIVGILFVIFVLVSKRKLRFVKLTFIYSIIQ